MATKKYFTDESLSTLIDQIKAGDAESLSSAKSYTDTEVAKITNGTTVVPEAEHATSADTANAVAWSNVTGKPSAYTPSSHSHAISDVTNLQSTIDTINTEIDGSIKSLSIDGKTITYTKNDGTTGTITTQDTNTDTKVTQTVRTTDESFPVLLRGTSAGTTTTTTTTSFGTGITANPKTSTLTATTFKGNLDGNAATATSATSATSATKATQDASGNVITSTYETKTDANTKLTEAKTYSDTNLSTAKSYTDTAISNLINSAPSTLDTLGEIATAMEENAGVVEALNDAIGTKVDKVSGKGLSTNDYTTTEKNKLAGIASGAQVNQNAFSNVKVGDTTIAADTTTDTLTLVAGSNITLTPDASGDSITIAATDTTYTLSSFGITATAAELNKLDGVTATTTELNYVGGVTSNIQTQLDGKQATISGAATTITSSNLTASRALISNSSGKVAVSAVTSTELGYLDGVTSAIQTQLDGKAASSHTHSYAGSSSAGGAATSANKVNSSLTVKLNSGTTEGTNMFTFNGSAAKSIDITPSAIGAAASSHTHSDATTSTAGFMTAAMVTKLNGIATGATKVTVDSSLSTSSTNPVRNSVVTSAINTATNAISANTDSISLHSTAISNLQTAVNEFEEITSAEISALFA